MFGNICIYIKKYVCVFIRRNLRNTYHTFFLLIPKC